MKVLHEKLLFHMMAGAATLPPNLRRRKFKMDGSMKLTIGIGPWAKTIVEFDSLEEEKRFIDMLCEAPSKERKEEELKKQIKEEFNVVDAEAEKK